MAGRWASRLDRRSVVESDDGTDHQQGPLLLEVNPELEARLLKAYEIVAAHYRQDMLLFWTRSSVFLLVQVGLVALVSAGFKSDTVLMVPFGLTGLGVSTIWSLVARSSARWIELWRKATVELDMQVNPMMSYAIDRFAPEDGLWRYGRPSHIGRALPALFVCSWLSVCAILLSRI